MDIDAMLNANGICRIADAYTPDEIALINAAIDPIFRERNAARRSYVHVDELQQMGLLETLIGPRMRDILFSIMPDPVLYHCLLVETAGNDDAPNLFAETLSGWHRDRDCSFSRREPTHVSLFIYLSRVGDDDGAFEFVPQDPDLRLRSVTPSVLVTGDVGYTFAWQRPYYHRASPNRGPNRRRLMKISIQRNSFESVHLKSDRFVRAAAAIPPGDDAWDILLGRYQGPGKTPPVVRPISNARPTAIAARCRLGLPDSALMRAQIRVQAGLAKDKVRSILQRGPSQVVYD